jgi:hypothetical protein
MQRLQREKEARIIAERRARAFAQETTGEADGAVTAEDGPAGGDTARQGRDRRTEMHGIDVDDAKS